MAQFQGSLGPIQDLQPKRIPAGLKPHKAERSSNLRAIAWDLLPEIIGIGGAAIVLIVLGLA